MIFFTSDLHFYHEKIIHHCNRPFQDAQVMNEKIIDNWNSVVRPEDDVFILGDVTMKGPEKAFAVLSRLAGNKFLIKGNHDKQYDMSLFEEITDFKTISANGIYIAMMHYPMLSWPKSHHGSLQLHGHVHGRREDNEANRDAGILRYDVGVDANNYCPVSIHQITTFFGI